MVYVIDKGVAAVNREFDDASGATRVTAGIDTSCPDFPDPDLCPDGNVPCPDEDNPSEGHGTHVAAIIGGRTFGLARDVTIVPVRSLCAQYGNTAVTRAFEYVLAEHGPSETETAIVNISGLNPLSTCPYDPSNPNCGHAVRNAVVSVASRSNILLVQSAGNQSFHPIEDGGTGELADACDHSLGDEDRYEGSDATAIARIVVAGGSDAEDGLWRTVEGEFSYPLASNIGSCVDVFAPAGLVVSAFHWWEDPSPDEQEELVCQLSGTSMAAPHVSGVAAMILSDHPEMNSDDLRTLILNYAGRGALQSSTGHYNYIGLDSPNLLLHWGPNNLMRTDFEFGDFGAWSDWSP